MDKDTARPSIDRFDLKTEVELAINVTKVLKKRKTHKNYQLKTPDGMVITGEWHNNVYQIQMYKETNRCQD